MQENQYQFPFPIGKIGKIGNVNGHPALTIFILASKMKPKFESLRPLYFCDIGIFDKVTVTLIIFEK